MADAMRFPEEYSKRFAMTLVERVLRDVGPDAVEAGVACGKAIR